ncbi:MAG: DUF222 domain-containing protein [Acidimicrobiales bacterium]|nr:DUF222 domain-containing protein [Acidimicrobiales bacterium]
MFGSLIDNMEADVDALVDLVRAAEGEDLVRDEAADVLVRLERQRERLEATIGGLVSDLDAREFHRGDAAYSMANWLASRTGQFRNHVGARVNLAVKLRSMPATMAALVAGELTHDHASVLSRALLARTADAFERDETMLVETARKLTADQLTRVIELWLRYHDPDGPEPRVEGEDDRFFVSQTLDGRLKGNFDLGGDLAVLVKTVIDELVAQLLRRDKTNRKADPTDPGLDQLPSQRRARALGELCERAAAANDNPAKRQPLITLHTTVQTLAGTGQLDDWMLEIEQAWTAAIPTSELHLWSCDCWISQIIIRGRDGEPLDAGREHRVASRAMRRALVARDGACCAVPGCDRPVGWCDAHHIIYWEHGGPTALDNLVFLCRWHHRHAHTGHLTVQLINGRPRFTNRDGHVLVDPRAGTDPPRPPDPPGDPPWARAA